MTPDLRAILAASGLEVVPAGEVERLRAALREIARNAPGFDGFGRCVLCKCGAATGMHAPWCPVRIATEALEGTR